MLEFLESMRKSVLERPDGGLTLGRRRWLWSEVFRQYPADARVRQAVLGHVVCKNTVADWESLSLEPTDNRLYYDFRALCRSVLLGELGGDAVRKQFTRLDGHAHLLGSVLMSQGEWNGVFALRAVCRACADAIRPDPLPTPINVELTDAEIDPDDLDPHFLASCIAARGATWEPSSDSGLRRVFWTNWLEELFPLVFSGSSELLELVRT